MVSKPFLGFGGIFFLKIDVSYSQRVILTGSSVKNHENKKIIMWLRGGQRGLGTGPCGQSTVPVFKTVLVSE